MNLLKFFLDDNDANKFLMINVDKCCHTYSSLSKCSLCIDNCPDKVLYRDNHIIKVAGNCSLCGWCSFLCPQHVFTIDEKKVIHYVEKNKNIVLSCVNQKKDTDLSVLRLYCLRQFRPEFFFILSLKYNIKLAIDFEICSTCNGWSIHHLQEFYKKFGMSAQVLLIDEVDLVKQDIEKKEFTRRELFKLLSKKESNCIEKEFNNDFLSGNYKKEIFEMNKSLRISDISLNSFTLKCFNCNGCLACIKLCPQNALKIDGEEFLFNPYYCTECNICIDTCALNGLQWNGAIDVSFTSNMWVSISHIYPTVCRNCESPMLSLDKSKILCDFCDNTKK